MTWNKCKHHAEKAVVLFLCGGGLYVLIELAWRGHTHWTMAILGGVLFLLIGGLNNWLPWEMPLALQCALGALIVTVAELLAGIILNIWLGLAIWDYSQMPGNFLGQICPQYTLAWVGLSLVAIVLDDYLRHWLWQEELPHYRILSLKRRR